MEKLVITNVTLNFTFLNGKVVKITSYDDDLKHVHLIADQLDPVPPPEPPRRNISSDAMKRLQKYLDIAFNVE